MYSLDINLLSERAEYQTGKDNSLMSGTLSVPASQYGKAPLSIGAGVAVLSLLGAAGGLWWTGQQTAQLEAKQKDLDNKLGSLKAQEQRLQQVTAQVDQITAESQSLASVFNQIQPWSAVLQDLRENTPQGIQIDNVAQSEVKVAGVAGAAPPVAPSSGGLINKISTPPNPEAKPSPSPSPGASPAAATATAAAPPVAVAATTATLPADVPTTKIDISGKAKSFDEVNNFILTLKQSAFFNPDETQLLSASLTPSMAVTKLESAKSSETAGSSTEKVTQYELPKVVDYKIQTSLKRIPSADLIRELERKGAVGLVTRLKTLQQQQAIKP